MVGTAALVIPALESGNLNASISDSTRAVIAAYVASGGLLITTSEYGMGEELLNETFGFTLVTGGLIVQSSLTLDDSAADGTPFEGAASILPDHGTTWGADANVLPDGAIALYEDNSDRVGVFLLPNEDGHILYLGWNWFDAEPVGVYDEGWLDILQRAMTAAETAGY